MRPGQRPNRKVSQSPFPGSSVPPFSQELLVFPSVAFLRSFIHPISSALLATRDLSDPRYLRTLRRYAFDWWSMLFDDVVYQFVLSCHPGGPALKRHPIANTSHSRLYTNTWNNHILFELQNVSRYHCCCALWLCAGQCAKSTGTYSFKRSHHRRRRLI